MARPTRAARKRAWAPKGRSGCRTCKIRHKRCDETKPFCLTCARGQYKCDGYEFPTSQKQQHAWKLGSDITFSQTLYSEPTQLLSADVDWRYALFFRRVVAPLLSTTRQWRSFWSSVVPQASWNHRCLHHAMIALAATYEAKTAHVDRSDLIMSRVNLATQEFATQPVSADVALIFCRLFSCMAQRTGDWQSAVLHLRSGGNILKEAARTSQAPSEIANLLAPTLLGITTSIEVDPDGLQDVLGARQFTELKNLYTKYGDFLRALNREQWMLVDGSTRSFILISWSIMTQAMVSIAYPNVSPFAPTNVVRSPAEVKSHLFNSRQLLSFHSLNLVVELLLRDLSFYVSGPASENSLCNNLKHRIQLFAENFLVQAAEIQPKMTAGAFWLEGADFPCSITGMVRHSKSTAGGGNPVGVGNLELSNQVCHASIPEDQQWYLEYVCPYRSGFIPAFLDPSFALT